MAWFRKLQKGHTGKFLVIPAEICRALDFKKGDDILVYLVSNRTLAAEKVVELGEYKKRSLQNDELPTIKQG